MQRIELFGSEIECDPVATTGSYQHVSRPDPSCCDACAAFAEIVRRGALPLDFTNAIRQLGMSPAKPQEVYGAPDLGALAGWYVFVGKLHTISSGEAEGAFSELSLGFRTWVTDRLVVHSWPDLLEESSLVQVEFDWQDGSLIKLNRAPA